MRRSDARRLSLVLTLVLSVPLCVQGCKNGDAAPAASVDAQNIQAYDDAATGIVRPAAAAAHAFEFALAGEADDTDRAMVPAMVTLRDNAVSAIVSPVEGRIETLYVVEGQRVAAGDVLATIRSPEMINLRAELRGANARLALARDGAARQEKLSEDGVAIAAEVAAARSALSEAEADVARLRRLLATMGRGSQERLELRASRDGVVLSRPAVVGDAVGPGEPPLMQIGDTSDLWVVAHVFESDLSRVIPDASARVHLPGGVGELRGRVHRVGDVVDASLRRAPVWIELDDASGVRPGMRGLAGLKLTTDAALRLPPQAVLLGDDGQYRVWVEVEPGAYAPRPVVVGQTRLGLVEVISGLTPGEKVVTRGALLLDASASMRL